MFARDLPLYRDSSGGECVRGQAMSHPQHHDVDVLIDALTDAALAVVRRRDRQHGQPLESAVTSTINDKAITPQGLRRRPNSLPLHEKGKRVGEGRSDVSAVLRLLARRDERSIK